MSTGLNMTFIAWTYFACLVIAKEKKWYFLLHFPQCLNLKTILTKFQISSVQKPPI